MHGVDDAWRARRAEFQREMRRIRGLDAPEAADDDFKLTEDLWRIAGETSGRKTTAAATL